MGFELSENEAWCEHNNGLFAARDCAFEWLKCLCEVWLGCSELAIFRHRIGGMDPAPLFEFGCVCFALCFKARFWYKRATRSVLVERSS